MARELMGSSPVFADWISECEDAFRLYVDWSLAEVLRDDAALDRVDVVQPALFAVLVGLARLWEHHGVKPHAVVGHSQGEIAAAYVAGALSLDDAARAVTLRSKAIEAIAGHGGMAAVMLSREETEKRLHAYEGELSLAAVNGPAASVVSGETNAIEKLLAELDADGVWARRIPVDYASHSMSVDVIEPLIREALTPIEPRATDITFCSTVSGEVIDSTGLDADYWYRNLRATVQFEPAVRTLLARGHRTFIEMSPHPVLTTALQQIDDRALALYSMHRDRPSLGDFLVQVGAAYAGGVDIDLDTLLPPAGPGPVDLPTYPFDRREYWPAAATPKTMIDRVMAHAGSGETLCSGAVGLDSHPWLADHAVGNVVLFPGAGFVDLALQAAQAVGLHGVDELAIEAPLILIDGVRRDLQVIVGSGVPRAVEIYSRPAGGTPDLSWTRHASGVLADHQDAPGAVDAHAWPPAGAEPADVSSLYASAEQRRYQYGPAFQRLTAVWRVGGEVYAEVELDGSQLREAEHHTVHPALLDACLHPMALVAAFEETVLPFIWHGVRLAQAGATTLRVRMQRVDADEVRLTASDTRGNLVLAVERLLVRPVSTDQLMRGTDVAQESLYQVGWHEVELSQPAVAPRIVVVETAELASFRSSLGEGAAALDAVVVTCTAADEPIVEAAERNSARLLSLLQDWIADESLVGTRLVVATHDAVAARDDDPAAGLAHAPVWGLVRSAQAEYPDRGLTLLDLDDQTPIADVIDRVVSSGRPQLAARNQALLAPRLERIAATGRTAVPNPDGTVLISGGLGTLGSIVGAHLVHAYGVRHLLLLGRRGAEGAEAVIEELSQLGTEVTVAACDVANRDALAEVLASVQPPLTGVVHAAGVLDDSLLNNLDDERLHRVMAPKVRGAWNLHELAGNVPFFVMFSSASGVVGSPGQANYAAANTFLDTLAQRRRAEGRHAQSLAWGFWAEASGMTGHLDEAAQRRMRRLGVVPMSTPYGLALLDAALGTDAGLLVTARLDLADTTVETLPPMLHGLVRRSSVRRATAVAKPKVSLATLPPEQRRFAALDLVRSAIAQVCGYETIDAVPADRRLRDLGIDSLTGVQLRNQLNAAVGLHLPVTVIFDHPGVTDLADGLLDALGLAEAPPPTPAEPVRGKLPEFSSDEDLFAFLDKKPGARTNGD
jgi:malonyl CoA-acyl carrier protein transacylase